MPMYEYKCSACGHEFEELVFGQVEAVPCPKCSSTDTRRLVSASCVRPSQGGSLGAPLGGLPAGRGCGSGGFT